VGKNGVGKSTLAKLLCGVLRPDTGRIMLGNQLYDAWVKPGQYIAYHFQNPDLQLFSTRLDEEIIAGPRAQGHNEEIIRQRQDALSKAFGLSRIMDEHPLSLPFVIRKRIALAATLAMGCPWVILDEPTVGQDDATVQVIAQIIEQMLAKGLGVIMISHSEWFRSLLPHEVIELKRM
jgi:energy-coupling factor transport system ATP-binding protein